MVFSQALKCNLASKSIGICIEWEWTEIQSLVRFKRISFWIGCLFGQWFDSLTTFEVPFIFIIKLMFKVAIIFHRSNPTIPFFSFNLSSSAHREFFNFQAYFFKSYRRWAKSRGINFFFLPIKGIESITVQVPFKVKRKILKNIPK